MTPVSSSVAGRKFDQTLYWRRRHQQFRGDPRSVGNLGKSLLTSRAVADDIAQALPATLELVLFTLFLIGAVAVPLGVLAARRHNSWIDNASRLVSLLGVVTPGFVVAILLQLLVSHFHFFPLTGRLSTDINFTPDITHLALVDSLLKEWVARMTF